METGVDFGAGTEAATGSGADVGVDTSVDTGVDTSVDTGADIGADIGADAGGLPKQPRGCGGAIARGGDIFSSWWVVCAQKFSTAVSRLRTLSSVAVDFERSSWITPE